MLKLILSILGLGIKSGYKLDSQIEAEFLELGENYCVEVKVGGTKLCLKFALIDDKVRILKKKDNRIADLEIEIKNKKVASKVFLGAISIKEAFCRHYFLVRGDIAKALGVVRILERVELYLFPKFITKKILFPEMKKETNSFRFYLKTFLGV